jgi:transcriptional antiterminator RfaH
MLNNLLVNNNMNKWLVVCTLTHRENYACENLMRQHFHIYCPMLTKRIKHARNVYDAPRPLFPGYIFVEYKPKLETWRPILGTYGVKSVVRIGEQPSLLCGSFIDGLKARETDGVIRKQASPLEVGQDVAIQGGPFDGLVGKVLELRDKDRVLLLLHLLDQQTKTHVRSDMLNPI